MTAATVRTNPTTQRNRATAARHRATSNPVRATKAALRSYQRTIATRRDASMRRALERVAHATTGIDPKDTQS